MVTYVRDRKYSQRFHTQLRSAIWRNLMAWSLDNWPTCDLWVMTKSVLAYPLSSYESLCLHKTRSLYPANRGKFSVAKKDMCILPTVSNLFPQSVICINPLWFSLAQYILPCFFLPIHMIGIFHDICCTYITIIRYEI